MFERFRRKLFNLIILSYLRKMKGSQIQINASISGIVQSAFNYGKNPELKNLFIVLFPAYALYDAVLLMKLTNEAEFFNFNFLRTLCLCTSTVFKEIFKFPAISFDDCPSLIRLMI